MHGNDKVLVTDVMIIRTRHPYPHSLEKFAVGEKD